MKKTTLRDVAKEAGVSVATVSYVLNNVSKQTIPEETRQRVFQAASKLKYVQNLTAKALSLGKTNVLGVLIVSPNDAIVPKTVSYGAYLDRLERRCREKGYHLLISQLDPSEPSLDIIAERKLDGVFLIDAVAHSFHAISSHLQYGSPLVLIDGRINDPLFREVMPDLQGISEILNNRMLPGEPFALIHEQLSNIPYEQSLRDAFGLDDSSMLLATSEEEVLRSFIERHSDKSLVVFNEFVALQALRYRSPESIVVVCTSECPELLPARMRKLVPLHSKADASFDLMSELLVSPFGSSLDGRIPFRADCFES
ncbi:LacI family DNA-binding transcriptional regulator [Paenibacillus sp. YIM B09110]|uniref:LacI family DNA-binding transcriptional regulator n=1 Tax=Paenibacillus sp. YIM B09110 TaxID=3126102 RepID=UPI00301D7551